jgi:Protein of unknown function (DUF2970)
MAPQSGIDPEPSSIPKKATLLHIIRIVISMLFMIGRNRDYDADAPIIGPAQLIIVAIVGAALLIVGLVLLASFIVH